MEKVVTLGFDVEEFDFPTERGRKIDFETQLAVSTEGLESLLGLLEHLGLKATFYTTANYADHRPELIRSIADAGHEIASHDYFHDAHALPDPLKSRLRLEEITRTRVVGYRAPRLAAIASETLAAAGYRYDSSLNPTCIPGRYNNLLRPRGVFREGGLCIYPASVSYPCRIPLFWISLHVMPLWFYRSRANSALRRDGHLNLYFHPWEFSERLVDERFGVPGYLTRCSGMRLLHKFERLLTGLKADGCRFTTTRNYLGFDE